MVGLARQLRTGQVVWSEDAVDVRRPFPLAVAGLGVAAVVLGLLGSPFVLVAGAVVLLIGIFGFVGLRVAADAGGVAVRNWFSGRRFDWRDVAEVRVRTAALKGTCIEIVLTDGQVALPGATRQTRLAYSRADLDRIALRLDALRLAAVGRERP